jgi:hypothetical protein
VGLRIVELLDLSDVPTVVVDDNPDLRRARSLIGPYEELLAVLRRDRPVVNISQIE